MYAVIEKFAKCQRSIAALTCNIHVKNLQDNFEVNQRADTSVKIALKFLRLVMYKYINNSIFNLSVEK